MKGYMDKQSTKDKQSNKGKNFIGTVLSIYCEKDVIHFIGVMQSVIARIPTSCRETKRSL